MTNRQNFFDLMKRRTQQDIADHLATDRTVVSKMISGKRGFSPSVARKAALLSDGEAKAGNLYLESQVSALKQKLETGKITPENSLGAAQVIMRTITKGFRGDELDRNSKEFREAAELLKKIAEAALDLAGPDAAGAEPVNVTGDSVEQALKNNRDPFGKALPETGEAYARDGFGRRMEK